MRCFRDGVMNNPFTGLLRGKTVFIGVGNRLRCDDGVGPAIIEGLRRTTDCTCIDAGELPENHVGPIVRERPDTVLIIDAVHLNDEPGAYEILREEGVAQSGFSTHTLSPHLFIRRLREMVNADIMLLGVQPLDVKFGEHLSQPVEAAVQKLVLLLTEACRS
jgi:hydrogenase 3 maturation protease